MNRPQSQEYTAPAGSSTAPENPPKPKQQKQTASRSSIPPEWKQAATSNGPHSLSVLVRRTNIARAVPIGNDQLVRGEGDVGRDVLLRVSSPVSQASPRNNTWAAHLTSEFVFDRSLIESLRNPPRDERRRTQIRRWLSASKPRWLPLRAPPMEDELRVMPFEETSEQTVPITVRCFSTNISLRSATYIVPVNESNPQRSLRLSRSLASRQPFNAILGALKQKPRHANKKAPKVALTGSVSSNTPLLSRNGPDGIDSDQSLGQCEPQQRRTWSFRRRGARGSGSESPIENARQPSLTALGYISDGPRMAYSRLPRASRHDASSATTPSTLNENLVEPPTTPSSNASITARHSGNMEGMTSRDLSFVRDPTESQFSVRKADEDGPLTSEVDKRGPQISRSDKCRSQTSGGLKRRFHVIIRMKRDSAYAPSSATSESSRNASAYGS